MDTSKQPNMKPVLVQRVSDEIRDLRKDDVALQQTVLTARAVSDLFRGDSVNINNARDKAYFTQAGYVDLNKITESGCRFISEASYVNGPSYAVRVNAKGEEIQLGGFLYTMDILPDGQLLWGVGRNTNLTAAEIELSPGVPDPNGPFTGISKRNDLPHRIDSTNDDPNDYTMGAPIRQLFYVANRELDEPEVYTRIGEYVPVTDDNGNKVYDSTGKLQCQYEWGQWVTFNGKWLYIVVTDASIKEVVNPIVNAVYSVHTNIPEFALPDANKQKYGITIRIIQHPDPNVDNRELWATNVVYVHGQEGDDDYEKMQVTCTPAPRRNTVRVEDAYKDGLVPTEYIFEVAPRMDDQNKKATLIGKTWHLKVDADETEFTTGIVELLDAHTELGIADIIDYTNRKFAEDNGPYPDSAKDPIYINRAVLVDGFIKLTISKDVTMAVQNWSLLIKRLDSRNPISFIPTEDLSPIPGKVYFKRSLPHSAAEGVYSVADDLVDDQGNILAFNCNLVYYEINPDATVEDLFTVVARDLQPGIPVSYQHKIYRNDVVYVVIYPGEGTRGHQDTRGRIFPSLAFVPNPHPGSYIVRGDLNEEAFTHQMFESLKANGRLDKHLQANESPASSASVIKAYTYLASRMQERGLLFGAVDANTSPCRPNEMTQTGIYWISTDISENELPSGIDQTRPARLIVFGEDYAPGNMIHHSSEYFPTSDLVRQMGKTYYIVNANTGLMEEAQSAVEFGPGIQYYEKIPGGTLNHDADITQIIIQSRSNPAVWLRTGEHPEQLQGGVSWGEWVGINGGTAVRSYEANTEYFSAETLKPWLLFQNLEVFYGTPSGWTASDNPLNRTIVLPKAVEVPYGRSLTLFANVPPGAHVNVRYTHVSYTTEDTPTGRETYTITTTRAKNDIFVATAADIDVHGDRIPEYNGNRDILTILEFKTDGNFWYYRVNGEGGYRAIPVESN